MDFGKIENVALITAKKSKDEIGQYVDTETTRTIMCRVSSVSRAEWSAAGQNGLVPSLLVTTFSGNYHGESKCMIGNDRYAIYRTYLRQDRKIELYLQKEAGI